jgi:hypothetical protein
MIKNNRILNLEQMLEIYNILKNYLIDNQEENNIIFIQGILDKITPQEYIKCVCLLTGTEINEISKEDSISSISAFTNGLFENKIVVFQEFAERVGLI